MNRVSIKGFRSIAELDLSLTELTALVGGNGSGKSNVLRALNLFFNNEVEAGDPLQLARDVHRPWNKKNRVVEVGVQFELPPEFNIHKKLRDAFKQVGIEPKADFAFSKRWTSGATPDEPPQTEITFLKSLDDSGTPLAGEDVRAAERFLRLIHFRYVPNHEHPSRVLAAEQSGVQEALIKALRRKRATNAAGEGAGKRFDAALEAMADAAQALVEPINESLGSAAGHVESLALATPDEWEQVVWRLDFQLKAAGLEPIGFELHGSGNQSQVMYELLYFLDTRYAESFGWHQATVWAIEEPESFLHADLKNDLVVFLCEKTSSDRFQALVTTHDLMVAAGTASRQWFELDAGNTVAEPLAPTELAARAISEGVSTYAHPLHLTAMKPTLLLEGPSDVWFVHEAYRHAGRMNPWDIRWLDEIDQGAGGGKDSLKKYLGNNRAALRARPAQSPVIVVVDWEVKEGEVQALNVLVSEHPPSSATRWPADKVNPDLGASFVGIERFLGTELIATTASLDPDVGITQTVGAPSRYELAPQKKTAAKALLLNQCKSRDKPDDLQPIIDLLPWLESLLPTAAQMPIAGV